VRSIDPSFHPADYEVSQLIRNQENGYTDNDFFVEYRLRLGEYATSKGYSLYFADDRAVWLMECDVSSSVPSASVISKLPKVTDEIVQAAYRQGREEVHARNPDFVVREQSGQSFYILETNECIYNVRSVYTTSATSPARGVVDTKYKIA